MSNSVRDTDNRLEALESKLAFQEDTIQALNEALIGQQARIDELELMLKMAVAEFGPGDDDPAEPPPPHY